MKGRPRSARTRRGAGVVVDAPARLHFGMLDLRGDRGRRFGGIGAAIPTPSVRLQATRTRDRTAVGPEADRALSFAAKFAEFHGLKGGYHLQVHRVIPAHAGLGSGTQLGLSVARGLAELYHLDPDAGALAMAVGRGSRSAIGTWVFQSGGFVLEGGKQAGSPGLAPLLARLPMPEAWRCVLAVPAGTPGLSGEAEAAAFDRLPRPPAVEVERVAHLVLMQLLPAVAEADLPSFGAGLTEVQRITGGWFGPAQGGAFARGNTGELVRRLEAWGAAGVGQSSWGPAVYGIVGSEAEAGGLAARTREYLGPAGLVLTTPFTNHGARVSAADPQD
jgi:beta-RFAP synthase